jgi:hypothetical protein
LFGLRLDTGDEVGQKGHSKISEALGRTAPRDFDHQQAWVATAFFPPHGDVRLAGIVSTQRDSFWQLDTIPRLFGRASVDRAVRSMDVVPMSVFVQLMLDASQRAAGQNATPPDSESAEGTFDLAVEKWGADFATHMRDAEAIQASFEFSAKLRAMIRDEKRGAPCDFATLPTSAAICRVSGTER